MQILTVGKDFFLFTGRPAYTVRAVEGAAGVVEVQGTQTALAALLATLPASCVEDWGKYIRVNLRKAAGQDVGDDELGESWRDWEYPHVDWDILPFDWE